MQKRISDMPPLLPQGITSITVDWLREHCVSAFPLSSNRQEILSGFLRIVADLNSRLIPCDLIVDGSYLTEEIDPGDIDFAVCVSPQFYESCSEEQLTLLDWIGNDVDIKRTHLCDCYLCVEYQESDPNWFEGIQNRRYWVNLFSKSKIYERVRRVGLLKLNGGI